MRKGWKKGDWLVVDEESGHTRYASQVKQDWKGLYVTKRYADFEQPQDFIRPLDDPNPAPFTTSRETDLDACIVAPTVVGRSNVPAPRGPATHFYEPGIGQMTVGCTFVVR